MNKRVAIFLLLIFSPVFAAAHATRALNDSALVNLYQKMSQDLAETTQVKGVPSSDIAFLKYGRDRIQFRQSAFSAFVIKAIKASDLELEAHCPACVDHEHEYDRSDGPSASSSWAQRAKKLARLKTVQISSFAYKGLKQYGLMYALFFVVFETSEHTLFAWLPPMCPVYHAGYFAVANTLRPLKLLFNNDLGLRLSDRARALLRSLYLDVVFWKKLRWLSFPDSPYSKKAYRQNLKEFQTGDETEYIMAKSKFWGESYRALHTEFSADDSIARPFRLEDDIQFIFSQASPKERYWVAKRHADGFSLLLSFLTDVTNARFERHELNARDLLRVQGVLGSIGRNLNQYRETLKAYALTDSSRLPQNKKIDVLEQTRHFRNVFVKAEKIFAAPSADLLGITTDLASMTKPDLCTTILQWIRPAAG